MNRFMTLALVARIAFGAFILVAVGPDRAYADPAIIPHPVLEQTADVVTKQLGNFGESFVDAGLRARGFQVVDGNVGVNGIDRIGVIDATGHPKRGDQTPGVAHQYCGQSGKLDNCVVAQHLLFTDNNAKNPFSCTLASDLYIPAEWIKDRERCRKAGIPDTVAFRTKGEIALDQVGDALAAGVKLDWVVFDEDYGKAPPFWFALDRMGQQAVGEVPANFYAWVTRPACRSAQAAHGPRRVDIGHQLDVMHLLQHLVRERDMAVTVVMHDINLAIRFCNRVLVMERGQLVGECLNDGAANWPLLERAFGVTIGVNALTDNTQHLSFSRPWK